MKLQLSLDDLDLIEANEAFAAQSLAVSNELKWDLKKKKSTWSIRTRILVTLVHELIRTNKSKGIATLCIGGDKV